MGFVVTIFRVLAMNKFLYLATKTHLLINNVNIKKGNGASNRNSLQSFRYYLYFKILKSSFKFFILNYTSIVNYII